MLDVLGFRINTPTTHTFLSMYKQVGHCIGGGGCYVRGRVYVRGTFAPPTQLPVQVQAGYGMRLLFCRNLAAIQLPAVPVWQPLEQPGPQKQLHALPCLGCFLLF